MAPNRRARPAVSPRRRSFIDDTANLSVLEARAKARRIQAEHRLELVVIDYLQLMQGRWRAENRQQEISEISRSLKALAKELNVPVVALSQLSRAVEARGDALPRLSDLRESGALEQDADLIMFLARKENAPDAESGTTDLVIGKHRNGPTGRLELVFHVGVHAVRQPRRGRPGASDSDPARVIGKPVVTVAVRAPARPA